MNYFDNKKGVKPQFVVAKVKLIYKYTINLLLYFNQHLHLDTICNF